MSDIIVEQLQSLLPPVSYDPQGKVLLSQLQAEANSLQQALSLLEEVESAVFPESAGQYIADWERVYQIVPPPGASQEERVQAVLAAMGDLGGQSIPYFIRLASLLGVKVDIDTFRVPVVGLLNTGDPIYSGDWPFTWRVNARLKNFTSPRMESRLEERRPANTDVIFGYGKEVVGGVTDAVDKLFTSINYIIPSSLRKLNG
ncbi:putative phage tail protein [Pseudomonas sp. NMI1173_11]|uniref:putative phage tail protein n=1 Tax=Pseudomonas sp. NMI1173_11 TaxID=2903145 RepID=UPI001E38F2CC|nr:putative phage tail protein [Pseudomonas sp. NMI1173_11]MCE0999379.1 DUF2313 domain-containing protein [Pseudomonas sp. NMI1173_11]